MKNLVRMLFLSGLIFIGLVEFSCSINAHLNTISSSSTSTNTVSVSSEALSSVSSAIM